MKIIILLSAFSISCIAALPTNEENKFGNIFITEQMNQTKTSLFPNEKFTHSPSFSDIQKQFQEMRKRISKENFTGLKELKSKMKTIVEAPPLKKVIEKLLPSDTLTKETLKFVDRGIQIFSKVYNETEVQTLDVASQLSVDTDNSKYNLNRKEVLDNLKLAGLDKNPQTKSVIKKILNLYDNFDIDKNVTNDKKMEEVLENFMSSDRNAARPGEMLLLDGASDIMTKRGDALLTGADILKDILPNITILPNISDEIIDTQLKVFTELKQDLGDIKEELNNTNLTEERYKMKQNGIIVQGTDIAMEYVAEDTPTITSIQNDDDEANMNDNVHSNEMKKKHGNKEPVLEIMNIENRANKNPKVSHNKSQNVDKFTNKTQNEAIHILLVNSSTDFSINKNNESTFTEYSESNNHTERYEIMDKEDFEDKDELIMYPIDNVEKYNDFSEEETEIKDTIENFRNYDQENSTTDDIISNDPNLMTTTGTKDLFNFTPT